jgi:transcriptional regulator with XRE-family HTH domain
MAVPGRDTSPDEVGLRLRRARQERRIGVRELARRVDVSSSLISQIERGKTQPSVRTLHAITNELGISLDQLLDTDTLPAATAREAAARDPKPTTSPSSRWSSLQPTGRVQRSNTRKVLNVESGVRWERLTATPDPLVDFLYVVHEVGGGSSPSDALVGHSGFEYGVVVQGRLTVTVGFETYELDPGDSISFDSSVPHRISNHGDDAAHAFWFVIGRHGDPREGFRPWTLWP